MSVYAHMSMRPYCLEEKCKPLRGCRFLFLHKIGILVFVDIFINIAGKIFRILIKSSDSNLSQTLTIHWPSVSEHSWGNQMIKL